MAANASGGAIKSGDDRWYFTKAQLDDSPSRRCGMDADRELSNRQQAANLIQDMGQRLAVSQLCINTAIVYMHRFYAFHSFTRFHRNQIAPCALFLAAKVEEQPRKLEHVIKASHRCLSRDSGTLDVSSDLFKQQAARLVKNENIMLQTLGFDVGVTHPHTAVVKCCNLVRASKDLAQTSYFMATNSLHLTTMCLMYRPTVVACACIHLACKWSSWEIPRSREGKDWFRYVDEKVTLEELEQLTSDFLTILDKCPSRLKRRVMSGGTASSNSSSHYLAADSPVHNSNTNHNISCGIPNSSSNLANATCPSSSNLANSNFPTTSSNSILGSSSPSSSFQSPKQETKFSTATLASTMTSTASSTATLGSSMTSSASSSTATLGSSMTTTIATGHSSSSSSGYHHSSSSTVPSQSSATVSLSYNHQDSLSSLSSSEIKKESKSDSSHYHHLSSSASSPPISNLNLSTDQNNDNKINNNNSSSSNSNNNRSLSSSLSTSSSSFAPPPLKVTVKLKQPQNESLSSSSSSYRERSNSRSESRSDSRLDSRSDNNFLMSIKSEPDAKSMMRSGDQGSTLSASSSLLSSSSAPSLSASSSLLDPPPLKLKVKLDKHNSYVTTSSSSSSRDDERRKRKREEGESHSRRDHSDKRSKDRKHHR